VGWGGEDAGDACALRVLVLSLKMLCIVLRRLFMRTVLGPAPMRIASPFGAIVAVSLLCCCVMLIKSAVCECPEDREN
jgi:hypothetical protein